MTLKKEADNIDETMEVPLAPLELTTKIIAKGSALIDKDQQVYDDNDLNNKE